MMKVNGILCIKDVNNNDLSKFLCSKSVMSSKHVACVVCIGLVNIIKC